MVTRFQGKASSSSSQSASFTPNAAAIKGFSLNKCISKNGPRSVSLLQLKCLEPPLSRSELALLRLLRIHIKQFQFDWLYDEIINSYLWCLCKQHPNFIYASSVIGQVLQKGCSIEKLWDGIDLFGKKWLFSMEPFRVAFAVELRKKFLQNDNSSCGVYVCWYAKLTAEEKDLSV